MGRYAGRRVFRARKVDSTHSAIVDGLRKLGVFVWDCHAAGGGGPDILACYQGRFIPMEIKPPLGPKGGGAQLNELEKEFHRNCPARIPIVRSIEEAWAEVTRNEP